jgi:transcriptional regulator GlxA family with amidase domain
MKHITIIVPDGESDLSTVASIIGAYEIFVRAGEYWKNREKKELYTIELAGVTKKMEVNGGMVTVKPHVHISEITKTDLIIIPPNSIRTYDSASKENRMVINWFTKQYKNNAEVASICTGGFMLASSGLLDGKKCSTHWVAADRFRLQYPQVNVLAHELITDENGLYTNGGGYSFLNLIIYLVEKYYDGQTAIYCSKIFQIEIDRNSQSAFAIFTPQKLHGDEMVQQAQAYIESKLDEKISVDEMSSRFAVGRRNFDRRFMKATGNTPLEYAQRVKVESAKKALETSRKTIHEVMYEVGYADVKAFREVFRKMTGMSPLEYRNKYNKEAAV